ncbi:MAG: dephospho-CoA kinase [Isosphaeraceae bacterium]
MAVLGLIGGIGAGKSRVAAEFAEAGAFVLDADRVGHALLDQKPAREEVVARFGPEVLAADDPERIDRKALGALVFQDPGARADLEKILHPRMRRSFEKAIARVVRRREAKVMVLDAAILLEAGWDDLCDEVAFVDAPDEARRARVEARNGWSAEDLKSRESAQWPIARKRARAQVIIANDGPEEAIGPQVRKIYRSFLARLHSARADTPRTDPASPPPPRPAPQGRRPRKG